MHGTSGRQRVTWDSFRNLSLLLPPLSTQHRIASILSSLDEKIELNRQINATLEAMAQAIFKEWFVDFNFPGATGEMVESELGPIPRGWRVGSISDIVFLSNDSITPNKQPDTLFYHYSIPAYDDGCCPAIEAGSSILSNKFRVKNNSILVSKLNPRIPRIWAVKNANQENSICSTEFQVLLPRKLDYFSYAVFLFYQQSIIDTMKSRASGTSGSHQRVNPKDILSIEIVIPSDDVLSLYEAVVGHYFQLIRNGLEESSLLTQLRDSLLPKLMSGEIEV